MSNVLQPTEWWSKSSPEEHSKLIDDLESVDLDAYDDTAVIGAAEKIRGGGLPDWVKE